MKRDEITSLGIVAALFALALLAAGALYGYLSSTGTFKSQYGELGGAAAGFAIVFTLLALAYQRIKSPQEKIRKLEEELKLARERFKKDLENERERLAEVIANQSAYECVVNAEKDLAGLTTSYNDIWDNLESEYRDLGGAWLRKILQPKFEMATRAGARRIPELRTWKPPTSERSPDQVRS